jgi:hypothetical protein
MVTFEKSGLSCAKFAQCVKLEEIAAVMHIALHIICCWMYIDLVRRPKDKSSGRAKCVEPGSACTFRSSEAAKTFGEVDSYKHFVPAGLLVRMSTYAIVSRVA